jgi:hypothetical protein
LTALFGTFYDQQNSKKKQRTTPISSILGFVISMKKEVLEQREYLKILHEEMERGEHPNAIPDLTPALKKSLKRSLDFHYISDSSEENTLEQISKKRSKR